VALEEQSSDNRDGSPGPGRKEEPRHELQCGRSSHLEPRYLCPSNGKSSTAEDSNKRTREARSLNSDPLAIATFGNPATGLGKVLRFAQPSNDAVDGLFSVYRRYKRDVLRDGAELIDGVLRPTELEAHDARRTPVRIRAMESSCATVRPVARSASPVRSPGERRLHTPDHPTYRSREGSRRGVLQLQRPFGGSRAIGQCTNEF